VVRVVGEEIEADVMSIQDALKLADSLELDLVEISPNADPPVCRIVDYQKFLYQQKKKQKEIKAKTSKVVVKEIRFGPNTDDHDYDHKFYEGETFFVHHYEPPIKNLVKRESGVVTPAFNQNIPL
jgi:translation initiation factor IF-3